MKRNPTAIEVVAVALIDWDGRILLQKRRAERQHGGLWEFPGGKVEAGESALFALIREIDEELGVVVTPDHLSHLAAAADPDGALVISLYTCLTWHGEPRCLDAAAIGWFAPHELHALAMPPLDRPLAAALDEWLQGR
jgi:8-oxo-dGTP diphosphatase